MNNCHKQFPIGTRVEVTREYEGVPKGAYNGVFEQCFQKYLNTFSKNKF